MPLTRFAAAVAVALAAAGAAQPTAREVAAAVRAFRRAFDQQPGAAALAALDGLDGRDVAGALVGAYEKAWARAAEIDEERARLHDEVVRGARNREQERKRGTLRANAAERAHALREDLPRLLVELDGLRQGLRAVEERVAALADADAHEVLSRRVLGAARSPLALRLAAAAALAAAPSASTVDRLRRLLERTADAEVRVGVLEALRHLGRAGAPAADAVLRLLSDRVEVVRERAAMALAHAGVAAAAAPLIELLAQEQGEVRRRMVDALTVLTGAQPGDTVASWRAWLASEGAARLADADALGQGRPAPRRAQPDAGTYMGIPIDGKVSVFVLDASGSMMAEVPPPAHYTAPPGTKVARLLLCKQELSRALGRLPADRFFNVVFFHEVAVAFADAPVAATADNVDRARRFVAAVQAGPYTNVHDGMMAAMRLATGSVSQADGEPDLDTVFLLTDGRPALRVRLDDGHVRRALRFWDPLRRVRVHTIAVGRGVAARFLRQLSADTGGIFQLER